jgi:hypothetical protein
MSQKSSLPQPTQSVSRVLTADTFHALRAAFLWKVTMKPRLSRGFFLTPTVKSSQARGRQRHQ